MQKKYSLQKNVLTRLQPGFCPPREFIDDRVMLEAKRLLAHTTESIKAIGFDLGFDEPPNFFKYFRKHGHLPPAEFRKKNKQD
ncbi:helix-turn-helix domain-containing protein [Mucilaginibacter sp.]|uniref:helix-turn-helix domain-containing protein n=1 Tax=Mucilaginibacter sp. TaxID=1882438 RepID=UPI00284BAD81|nr:helix-turn-helix domain-containing protein [Mucilaginibacter sp.]MDR3693201.1 helix-turn-helix domain-containing protein [Mucilaginibacter sp.]